jgi:Flp pilus assembly pilin Flp
MHQMDVHFPGFRLQVHGGDKPEFLQFFGDPSVPFFKRYYPKLSLSLRVIRSTFEFIMVESMVRAIKALFRQTDGQDLVEYTLLLAFIALVGISIVMGASGSIQGIWGSSNATLVAANTTASGGAPAAATGGTGGDGGNGGGDGDHH